jgi:hypothetical protein
MMGFYGFSFWRWFIFLRVLSSFKTERKALKQDLIREFFICVVITLLNFLIDKNRG